MRRSRFRLIAGGCAQLDRLTFGPARLSLVYSNPREIRGRVRKGSDTMGGSDWTPSDEVLIAFDQGLLPADQIDAVTRWLASSPGAKERLRRLTQGRPDDDALALRQPCPSADELAHLSAVTLRMEV